MYSKSELLEEIRKGLYSSWLLAFSTNDTPYVSMKPEYMTTIMLGKHISDNLVSKFTSGEYMVRFEEQTKDVATRAFPVMPLPYTPKNVHGRAKKATGEEGAVDMVIYQQSEWFPVTRIIIEIKNFDQRDELLVKDLDRNKEFMELIDSKKSNQIQITVLAFFLHDKNSRTKEEAQTYINSKKDHYQKMTNKYCTNEIFSTLELDTLANLPSLSDADASEKKDEYGQPLVETEENHHIVYGVICMERKM